MPGYQKFRNSKIYLYFVQTGLFLQKSCQSKVSIEGLFLNMPKNQYVWRKISLDQRISEYPFNLSRSMSTNTSNTTSLFCWYLVGSMNWMAPEVLERPYDERSDVWSLGCIVLEMATCGTKEVNVVSIGIYLNISGSFICLLFLLFIIFSFHCTLCVYRVYGVEVFCGGV